MPLDLKLRNGGMLKTFGIILAHTIALLLGLSLVAILPYFSGGNDLIVIPILFISTLLFSLLSYPTLKKYLKGKSFLPKFRTLYISALLSFALIYSSSAIYNHHLGINQYTYRYGNYMPYLSIFTRHKVGQAILEAGYKLIPSSTLHYSLLAIEDSLKIFEIKAKVSHDQLCQQRDHYQCSYKIFHLINEKVPMTITGNILMAAANALFIFKDQNKNIKKVKNENKKKELIIESAQQLIQSTLEAQNAMLGGGRVRNLWDDFPAGKKIDDLAINSREIDMLLIENFENEISRKFFDVSSKKTSSMLKNIQRSKNCGKECQQYSQDALDNLILNQQLCNQNLVAENIDYKKYFPIYGRYLSNIADEMHTK